MEVALPRGVAPQLDTLEDFRFKGGAKSLDGPNSSSLRGLFEFGQRTDSKHLVQLEDFLWPQTGNRQHLQNAFWGLLTHAFKRRIGPCRVDAFYHAGDGLTDAGNLLKAIIG